MASSEIHVFDPRRLMVGKAPWGFLLEVAARGVVIYVVLLVAIRLMGKRVAGQLSLSELAVMVTLGAAIGVPMEVPENGILPGIVLLIVAVIYQRGIGLWSFKRRRIELLTQGDLVQLAGDGVMDLRAMRRVGLSRERVFAALREKGLVHMGQTRRVYIETSGSFSVFRASSPTPGLRMVPPDYPGLRANADSRVCRSCGNVVSAREHEHLASRDDDPRHRGAACPSCEQSDWDQPVLCDEA